MRDEEAALEALARRQRQVFSRQQAYDVGLDRRVVHRRVNAGRWIEVGPHTFTFAGVELDWLGRLQVGLLDLGDDALVTAEAAAALYGLDSFRPGPLVFTAPQARRQRRTSGDVITCDSLGIGDRRFVEGLPTASPTLTIIHLARRVGLEPLGDALDSARRKRLTTDGELAERLARTSGKGREGVVNLRRLLSYGSVESWLERRFIDLLPPGVPRPALQRVYRQDGVHVARVDFDFDPLPVIVEVGGRKGYLSAADRRDKERRRNRLQLQGKTVYFFTRDDIVATPGTVIATLRAALRHAV